MYPMTVTLSIRLRPGKLVLGNRFFFGRCLRRSASRCIGTGQQMKEEQAKKRKREAELKKVEARIEELETRDSEIDETMVLPDVCTNVAECTKLSREKAAIAEELEELYEKWEELA